MPFRHLIAIVAMILGTLILSACSKGLNQYQIETADGIATIGDIKQTTYIIGTQSGTAKIQLEAPVAQTIKIPLDVLILFDRTASMQNVINATAEASTALVNDIQAIVPNSRFAVASISDYSPLFTDDTDKRTWLLLTDFSAEAATVHRATSEIKLVNGGDRPEAYVRGFYEASELSWRKEAKKIILFFGDAAYHNPDPGRDEQLNTSDDLVMDDVVKTLKDKSITVVGIHTKNDAEVVNEFKRISQATGGEAVALDDAEQSAQVIKNSINNALTEPATLIAAGQHASWATISNSGNTMIRQGKIEHTISIKVPDGTPAGIYPIALTFSAPVNDSDALSKQLAGKPFEIKVITGWYNHPMVLWIPLGLFLLYLAWCTIRMLKGGYARTVHLNSNDRFNPDHYGLSHLFLDFLALASLVCSGCAIYLLMTEQVLSQIM